MSARRASLLVALVLTAALPAAAPAAPPSRDAWTPAAGIPAPSRAGAQPEVRPRTFRAFRLDHAAMRAELGRAPREGRGTHAIAVPAPGGGFERFAIERSSVMAPALAARFPEITTYRGRGLDDAAATIHLDLGPHGFRASVRAPGGSWYVDPYYRGERSLYAVYDAHDLENPHRGFVEREAGSPTPQATLLPAAKGPAVQLRTYRLALTSDPAYANYHRAGATDPAVIDSRVTSAKVTLVNRVNQIYEQDLAVTLQLVADNHLLNFNTAAAMTSGGGRCGTAPCFTPAEVAGCDGPTLDANHEVVGQVIGADDYDVGHIAMGAGDGGIAYLGVAGIDLKAGGCTALSTPTGDFFAVDYVAHELGHQFGGNHTFNGTQGSCAGNIAANSVEPGSGSTVMAYAGICAGDDLQAHSDPYLSQRSIQEMTGYVTSSQSQLPEVQIAGLRDWGSGDSFQLSFAGAGTTAPIPQSGYSANAVKSAVEAVLGSGSVSSVVDHDGSGAPTANGFRIRYAGTADRPTPTLVPSAGTSGFASTLDNGGPPDNGGHTVAATGNSAPEATGPANVAIPALTPFRLEGSATDADGDALTYSWEQNDAGTGKALLSDLKTSGPLFRQFASAAPVDDADALLSPAPGQNAAASHGARTFPDMAQVLAGNTNAATGSCPGSGGGAARVECFSEYLPKAGYAGPLDFRLTVRDNHPGAGGTDSVDVSLALAATAGPFRVTSQATPSAATAGGSLAVAWSVAGTNLSPVSTSAVRIRLSTDGGETFPHVLAESTPNDGSQAVTLPAVETTRGRILVEAVGNVFFDVSRADLAIAAGNRPQVTSDAPPGGVEVAYSDAPPATTISAEDPDTPGSALSATASGLPAGLSLAALAPAGNTRTWALDGTAEAAPGAHPVTVEVSDGEATGSTSFTVQVAPESATATYDGPQEATLEAGAATAPVELAATVTPEADGTPGDVTTATVAFRRGTTTLCQAPAVAADGSASCTAQLAEGTHSVTVVVGGRYTATAEDTVVVGPDPSAPVASHDAPAGGAVVQYSDPLGVRVTATDSDSGAATLTAAASGLPGSLALQPDGPGAWAFGGTVTAAPATYPVSVTVEDPDGHAGLTGFDVRVRPEGARATYTGPARAGAGAVTLRARIAQDADGSAGALGLATAAFRRGTATLCVDSTVSAAGDAACTATLGAAVHDLAIAVGGRFTGAGTGRVEVVAPSEGDPPATVPVEAALAPLLDATRRRVRLSRRGRLKVRVACVPDGVGTPPERCEGELRLRRRGRALARRAFAIAPGAPATLTLKVARRKRAALPRRFRARLVARVDGRSARRTLRVRR